MERASLTFDISMDKLLPGLMSRYYDQHVSFALWRLPNSNSVCLAGSNEVKRMEEVSLEESPPGYIFSPFHPDQSKIFLPADELLVFEDQQLATAKSKFLDEVRSQPQEKSTCATSFYSASTANQTSADQLGFQKLVLACRDEIVRGNAEKIVPSRSKSIPLSQEFDLVRTFQRLCSLYPHAMVSIFSSPATGTWIGATPEVLVTVTKDQRFRTVALAGTQPFTSGTDLRSVSWTQKDIEEQALVERYIISCFKKIRLREYEEHGPKTTVAGNVLHLKTDFGVDMVATNFPQLGSVMLKLLHPTSAVCGMPLASSLRFLLEHEGHDRQFYSGYLGPVNVDQESHLFVNLRCAQLTSDNAILYAGAGVLADSDPEREWQETELKMNTLGKVIRE